MNTLDDLKSGALKNAKRLSLRDLNGVFPDEIFDLSDTLEILDLNGNELSALPDDFARLEKLKILFLSDNDFETLPDVLSACKSLTMIGFKANKIRYVPEDALPLQTQWLILTDNNIRELPESIGKLSRLQKCMLAGNELTSLPASMSNCKAIELLRISANQFATFPDFILDLPKLAWLAFAGNPFHPPFETYEALPELSGNEFTTGDLLGEGASGWIRQAEWKDAPPELKHIEGEAFAFKAYKGAVTSDGYPTSEMDASLAVGEHPNLVKLLARTSSTASTTGLAMSLIPAEYKNLGLPPTFDTCTRDHFPEGFRLSARAIVKIARQIVSVMTHLRRRDICHGDLYAHNILVTEDGAALLSDFGGAANYHALPSARHSALERIEVRAFGCLLDDMLQTISPEDDGSATASLLKSLRDRCMNENTAQRPLFAELFGSLTGA